MEVQMQTAGIQQLPKVLVVDDDAADILLIKRAFSLSAIENTVVSANDGEEALETLRELSANSSAPDLILLDLNMPGMDGWDTLKHIRADEKLKKLPVVVLTTSESQRDVDSVYALNANCYVQKPIELDDFTNVILKISEFWLQVAKGPTLN